jgi:hypothetical protein
VGATAIPKATTVVISYDSHALAQHILYPIRAICQGQSRTGATHNLIRSGQLCRFGVASAR